MADKIITVKVTQRGFLYWVRHPGEVLQIAEHLFSKEWMEKIEATDAFSKKQSVEPPVTSVSGAAGPQATGSPNEPAASNALNTAPTNGVPPT